jgi:hypothetical protein
VLPLVCRRAPSGEIEGWGDGHASAAWLWDVRFYRMTPEAGAASRAEGEGLGAANMRKKALPRRGSPAGALHVSTREATKVAAEQGF